MYGSMRVWMMMGLGLIPSGCDEPAGNGPPPLVSDQDVWAEQAISGGDLAADDGAAGAQGPGDAAPIKAGDGVLIKGEVSYDGSQNGMLLIDAVSNDPKSPMIVYSVVVGRTGAFSVELPKDLGDVHLCAFLDVAGDGPSKDDPAGRTQASIQVGDDDIDDVRIVLKDTADLGPFSPWLARNEPGPPPEGAGEPREGDDPNAPSPPDLNGTSGGEPPPPGDPNNPEPPQGGPDARQPPPAAEGGAPPPGGDVAGDAPSRAPVPKDQEGGLFGPDGKPFNLSD